MSIDIENLATDPLPAFSPREDRPVEDYDMVIRRDGTWLHNGTPIGRQKLVKLFATVLRRDREGTYWLATPAEQGIVRVEDAPFVATGLTIEGEGAGRRLIFTTNLGHRVEAGPEHPLLVVVDEETGEPSPYITVRPGAADGAPGLEALITRAIFYDLVEMADERDGQLVLETGGGCFTLGPAA